MNSLLRQPCFGVSSQAGMAALVWDFEFETRYSWSIVGSNKQHDIKYNHNKLYICIYNIYAIITLGKAGKPWNWRSASGLFWWELVPFAAFLCDNFDWFTPVDTTKRKTVQLGEDNHSSLKLDRRTMTNQCWLLFVGKMVKLVMHVTSLTGSQLHHRCGFIFQASEVITFCSWNCGKTVVRLLFLGCFLQILCCVTGL